MIEMKDISKKFGEKIVFDHFNITIPDGDFVVLSGESGKGKTTFLNILGGLMKPDEGSVIIHSKNCSTMDIVKEKNLREYYGKVVGFLFQNFALVENKTVEYNMSLVGKKNRSGMSVEEALEFVGLPNVSKSKVYTLSGGEQQRIALARLLIKKCDIVLADEPTGSLDRKNAEKVIELLVRMNQEGKTIIMVTHDEKFKSVGKRVVQL